MTNQFNKQETLTANQEVLGVMPNSTTYPLATQEVPLGSVTPDNVSDEEIDRLGEKDILVLSGISNQMVSTVRASDADVFGSKLSELVTTAKGLNPDALAPKGVMSKISKLFGSAKDKMLGKFETVDAKMNSLISEMDNSATLFERRVVDLEEMFKANLQSHQSLENTVTGPAERMRANLTAALSQEVAATDVFGAQAKLDAQAKLYRLEKRIDDLKRAMMLAKQAAPEIRLLQENSRALTMKFKDVKAVTIPAWKNAFTLYLIQLEQKKGAELIHAVHDATDEAFKLQADLLRQNTQEIARANQRSIVSIETLEHVQKQLIGSFEDMEKIAEEGRAARAQAQPKLLALEQELINRFKPNQSAS